MDSYAQAVRVTVACSTNSTVSGLLPSSLAFARRLEILRWRRLSRACFSASLIDPRWWDAALPITKVHLSPCSSDFVRYMPRCNCSMIHLRTAWSGSPFSRSGGDFCRKIQYRSSRFTMRNSFVSITVCSLSSRSFRLPLPSKLPRSVPTEAIHPTERAVRCESLPWPPVHVGGSWREAPLWAPAGVPLGPAGWRTIWGLSTLVARDACGLCCGSNTRGRRNGKPRSVETLLSPSWASCRPGDRAAIGKGWREAGLRLEHRFEVTCLVRFWRCFDARLGSRH